MTVRLVVHLRDPADAPGAVERAFAQFARDFRTTSGARSVALLRAAGDPGAFAVVSGWRDLQAFEAWRTGPGHRARSTPLTPFKDRSRAPHWEVYEEVAGLVGIDRTSVADCKGQGNGNFA